MADIDSVIMGAQLPQIQSPLDNYGKLMNMQNLQATTSINQMNAKQAQQEYQDNQTLKNAQNKNTTVNPDGTYKIDQAGTLKDLAASDNPSLAAKQQLVYSQNNKTMQNNLMDSQIKQQQYIRDVMGTITDQKSLDQAHSTLQSTGSDSQSHLPTIYDTEETPRIIQQYQNGSLTAQQKMENQLKQQENQNKATELKMAMEKQYGTNLPGNTNQNTDPSTLIRTFPEAQQKDIAKEISNKQNLASIAPSLMDSFHKAGNNIHLADAIPFTTNADQDAYKTKLGALFNDIEDKDVKQAKVDALYNETVPRDGDSAYRKQQKANALQSVIASKGASPLFKNATSLDLDQFNKTKIDPSIFKVAGATTTAPVHPQLAGQTKEQLQAGLQKLLSNQQVGSR